jgi:membrane associated rhomboid family serine protease
MFPRARVRVLIFLGLFATVGRVTAFLFLGIWFLTQLLNGVASIGPATAQTAGVAYWAHIGGFVVGLVAGLLFRSRAKRLDQSASPSWRRSAG